MRGNSPFLLDRLLKQWCKAVSYDCVGSESSREYFRPFITFVSANRVWVLVNSLSGLIRHFNRTILNNILGGIFIDSIHNSECFY
jgi:hypothetical protein